MNQEKVLTVGNLVDRKEAINKMLSANVNNHTEKKGNLTYLSWAWAWAEALKADEDATFRVEMFGDKCYMDINGTAMVFVTVTMFRKPAAIEAASTIEELKDVYTTAYSACGSDKTWQKKVIDAKEKRKGALK